MPDDSPVTAARNEPRMPEAHPGDFMLYGSGEAEAKWTPCRFVFAPSWRPRFLERVRAELPPSPLAHLDAEGALHEGSPPPTPGEVMAMPVSTPDNPHPATIVIPPDALDMIGIRVRFGKRHCDVLSPAGRSDLLGNGWDAPSLARDIAKWTAALTGGNRRLPPRLHAGLMVETELDRIHDDHRPFGLPAGVTSGGLARWYAMQHLRGELRDEWTRSDCARVTPKRLLMDGKPVPNPSSTSAVEMLNDLSAAFGGPTPVAVWVAFSPLTTATADAINCVRLAGDFGDRVSLGDAARDAARQGWKRVDETWAGLAIDRIAHTLNYLLLEDRADMQLMTRSESNERDPVGAATDMLLIATGRVVHACTWPTWHRHELLVRPDEDDCDEIDRVVPMVTAREIPSMEEVQALATRVHERRREARQGREAKPAPLPAPAM